MFRYGHSLTVGESKYRRKASCHTFLVGKSWSERSMTKQNLGWFSIFWWGKKVWHLAFLRHLLSPIVSEHYTSRSAKVIISRLVSIVSHIYLLIRWRLPTVGSATVLEDLWNIIQLDGLLSTYSQVIFEALLPCLGQYATWACISAFLYHMVL